MKKIKIGVVEDEVIIADTICAILERHGYEVLEPVISYTAALDLIEEQKPDLLILDIQLSGQKDGIDLAWKIKENYQLPYIFLTSNADKATIERAKKVDPPAYLVKPFHAEELYAAIEIALHNYSVNQKLRNERKEKLMIKDALFIKQDQVFHKVNFDEIVVLKSDHVYVEVHTTDKKMVVRNSLSHYLEVLPDRFFRVHRSYVVNLDYLEAITSLYVVVHGKEIPIGRNYRNELMDKIQLD